MSEEVYNKVKTNICIIVNNITIEFDKLIKYKLFVDYIKYSNHNKKSLTELQNELLGDTYINYAFITYRCFHNNENFITLKNDFLKMIKILYELDYPHNLIHIGLFICVGRLEKTHDIMYFMNYLYEYINVKQKILENNSLEFLCIKKMILNDKSNEIPMYLKEKHDYIKY